MLNLRQAVYMVCKYWVHEDKVRMYVSKKEVRGINLDDEGNVIYTAGNYRELEFREIEECKYVTVSVNGVFCTKPVFLTKEEAEQELEAQLAKEKV